MATLSFHSARSWPRVVVPLLLVGWITLGGEGAVLAGVGGLDTGFGGTTSTATTGSGIATAQISSGSPYTGNVSAVTTETVLAKTDVVIAGQYNGTDSAVARFLPNGAPDSSFGANNGLVRPISGGGAEALAIDPSTGNIDVAGYETLSGVDYPALSRVSSGGAVLGTTSLQTGVTNSISSRFYGLGYDAINGDLIAAGIISTTADQGGEIVIAGYTPSGSLDTTNFCASGCPGSTAGEYIQSFSSESLGGDSMSPGSLAIDAAGNIYVVGTTLGTNCSGVPLAETFLIELSSSGAYDTSLNGSGHELITSATTSGSCLDSLAANSVTVLSSSGWPAIAISGEQYPTSGSATNLSGNGTLMALTSSGAPSGTFGGSGVTVVGGSTSSTGLAVASSSSIAIGNSVATSTGNGAVLGLLESGPVAETGNTYEIGTTLFGSSGSPQSTFGSNGLAVGPECSLSTGCGQGLSVQPDGNILVVGGVSGPSYLGSNTTSSVQNDLSVARLVDSSISISGPSGTVTVSGATTATFTVTFEAAPNVTASVNFSTQAGTALSGVNFSATSGSISFPCSSASSPVTCGGPSSNIATVAVPVLDPGGTSGTATFSLVLSNPTNAGLTGSSAVATLDYGSASSGGSSGGGSSSGGSSGGGAGGSGGGGSTTPAPTTNPPSVTTTTIAAQKTKAKPKAKTPAAGKGYWVVTSSGAVKAFGDATNYGSVNAKQLAGAKVAGIVAVANGTGYWIASTSGTVFSLGSAKGSGSIAKGKLSGAICGIAPQTNSKGYWLASTTGTVYALGSAKVYGSVAKGKLSGTVKAFSRTSSGTGYWLATSTGAVYSFGNAKNFGQLLGKKHSGTIAGFAALPNSTGYWLATTTGSVYGYGKATAYGSITAKMKLSGSIVSLTPTPDNKGYWLTSSHGQVFGFGDAHSYGSENTSIAVGMATT